MYLGVIAKPEREHNFDGKVYLKRVAVEKPYGRKVYSNKFSDNAQMNHAIKTTWKEKCRIANDPANDSEYLIDLLTEKFQFSDEVQQRLVLRYSSFGTTGKARKKTDIVWVPGKPMGDVDVYDEENGEGRALDLNDLSLSVLYTTSDTRSVDVNCESEFMMSTMRPIGVAIRQAFHWVPQEEEIDLIMDNAGGHGRKDIIDEYKELLKTEFNVRILHQEPRSPATNLLDLGAWVSLQSVVEKKHRGQVTDAEALARTIERVWETFDSSIFEKIYGRWLRVLYIIIADLGDNKNEDNYRGELFSALSDEVEKVLAERWWMETNAGVDDDDFDEDLQEDE